MNSSNEFQHKWDDLSKDVKSLNEYTAKHLNLELKNIRIQNINLDNAVFNGGLFENIVWEQVTAGKSKYRNVIFRNCKFLDSNFWNCEFVNVEFIRCEFISTNFIGSNVFNVEISNCLARESEFDNLKGGKLLITETKILDRSSFTDSKIPLIFRRSELTGVNAMGLSGNNSLMIENCLLDEVNFGKGHFSTVTLRKVRQGEGGVKFNGITADSIRFENVEMLSGTGLGFAKAKQVTIDGGKMYGPTFKGSHIISVYIRDAFLTRFALGNLGKLNVSNSILHRSGFFQGGIEEFSVQSSTIDEIVGKNFKADTVIWDNVTLDGKIDFTNAHIKDFHATRLKRGPNLQLITTGSNVKL